MVRTHASEPVDKPAAARPWRTLLWLAVGSLLLGTLALRVAPSLIDLLLVVCARAMPISGSGDADKHFFSHGRRQDRA